MSNLLEFKRSFDRAQRYFYELSNYSEHTYEMKLKDFYNHITQDYYMQTYFSDLKVGMREMNEKYEEERKKGAIFIPEDKEDRAKTVVGFMNLMAVEPRKGFVILHKSYKGSEFVGKYARWYKDIALPVFNDIFGEINFDIQTIENRNENKNKELEDIPVSTTNYHIHGVTYNSQFGNNNIQNINIDNLFGEIVDSEVGFSEDNRELIQKEVKNIENEVKKDNPSKEKLKGFLSKIYDKGETEVIKHLGTKLQHIPAVTTSIMELL